MDSAGDRDPNGGHHHPVRNHPGQSQVEAHTLLLTFIFLQPDWNQRAAASQARILSRAPGVEGRARDLHETADLLHDRTPGSATDG